MRFGGFALARRPLTLPNGIWWARVAVTSGWAYKLATDDALDTVVAWADMLFPGMKRAELHDPARNVFRTAAFESDRLAGALFVGAACERPSWDALVPLLAAESLAPAARLAALSGRPPDGADCGPAVCACFGVGRDAIRAAVTAGAGDVAALGAALRAGTNCGSCVPELKRILTEVLRVAA
jgi:assimilatory nitrate reductase catalytic subunit